MQPFRKSSLVQQPDGEITRAVVDAGSQPVAEFGIQFDLGMLGRKVAQDDPTSQKDLLFQAEAPQESSPGVVESRPKPAGDKFSKPRGLTVTTARTNIMSGSAPAQPSAKSPNMQLPETEISKQLIPAQPAQRKHKQKHKEQLPTISSVSIDAIPGLRRQASALDPEHSKQLEKGWGLSFKDPNILMPVRKEVEVTSPQEDKLERVRKITMEKEALAQQRAQAERAKQEAEAEQRQAAQQAKAAVKRSAVEAAAAQRAEDVRKRQEFMQETKKMYRAAVQQEEQHTPAFLRMQQQAQVKEAEEEAEKKRIWEEEVASKKFWYTDIQGSLEAAAPNGHSVAMSEGHTVGGSPSEPKGSSPSPGLSPETSAGHLQGEASQSSVGTASVDEQKKKSKREWQQSLRNSSRFKNSEAQRSPWGLSVHGPKLERRLKYHQTQDRGCSPMGPAGSDIDDEDEQRGSGGNTAKKVLDPLDDSNSLTDLAQSMYAMQPIPQSEPESAQASSAQPMPPHGPLVQLMHNITKAAKPGQAVIQGNDGVSVSDPNRQGSDDSVSVAEGDTEDGHGMDLIADLQQQDEGVIVDQAGVPQEEMQTDAAGEAVSPPLTMEDSALQAAVAKGADEARQAADSSADALRNKELDVRNDGSVGTVIDSSGSQVVSQA